MSADTTAVAAGATVVVSGVDDGHCGVTTTATGCGDGAMMAAGSGGRQF